MLRRNRIQPKPQPRTDATAFHEMAEGQRRLVQAGMAALRDPDIEQRVRAHLEERGVSNRDWIAAALTAARFQREGSGGVSQSA